MASFSWGWAAWLSTFVVNRSAPALIELTLGGALLLPCALFVPGLPHLSLGWLVSPSSTAPQMVRDDPTTVSQGADPVLQKSARSTPSDAQNSIPEVAQERPDPIMAGGVAASAVPPVAPFAIGFESMAQWIALAYVTGAGLVIGWWLVGVAQLCRLLAGAVPVSSDVNDLFRTIAGPSGKRVCLLSSQRIPLPLTFTLWRPFIVLPAPLEAEGVAALKYCLAHEWSHVEGHDSEALALDDPRPGFLLLFALLLVVAPPGPTLPGLPGRCPRRRTGPRNRRLCGIPCEPGALPLARHSVALGIGDRRSNLTRRIHMLLDLRQSLERRPPRRWNLAVLLVGLVVARRHRVQFASIRGRRQMRRRRQPSKKRSRRPSP